MKLVEPPSCSSASTIVFIGKNSRGNWVAQEQNGLYGGLFVNRAQAVKYALFENGHHPETIIEMSREIELDTGSKLPFPAAGTLRVAAKIDAKPGATESPNSDLRLRRLDLLRAVNTASLRAQLTARFGDAVWWSLATITTWPEEPNTAAVWRFGAPDTHQR